MQIASIPAIAETFSIVLVAARPATRSGPSAPALPLEIVKPLGPPKVVNFSDGRRWEIQFYSSGTQSIRMTEPDGSVYFWKGRVTLEPISDNPRTPLVRIVRTGTPGEWRSPAQSSQQAGGPLGRD